ncbi:hypothetical protein HRbin19_01412 [bacterium HR19]|nr:hypothetical protein HRbin19_01412 [bacterium HR19]
MFSHITKKCGTFLTLLSFTIFLFTHCKKSPPLWINSEQFIDTAQRGGFIVEVVGLYPLKTLAQLKCETQGRQKLKNLIQAELQDIFKTINLKDENMKKEFLRKLAEDTAKELSFKAEMVESYADEVNQVLYCKIFLKFDENFYKTIINKTEKILKENFPAIYEENIGEKIKREIYIKRGVRID